MNSLNKVTIIGNIGRDPEARYTQDGKLIVNLAVATSESWRDKTTGERKEKTEWHRVVIFNEQLAKLASEYLHKGSKVYIEGSLVTRKYTDKDGIERYNTEITLQQYGGQLIFLDARPQSDAAEPPQGKKQAAQSSYSQDIDEDSIPF